MEKIWRREDGWPTWRDKGPFDFVTSSLLPAFSLALRTDSATRFSRDHPERGT